MNRCNFVREKTLAGERARRESTRGRLLRQSCASGRRPQILADPDIPAAQHLGMARQPCFVAAWCEVTLLFTTGETFYLPSQPTASIVGVRKPPRSLVQHLTQRQHWLQAAQLPRHEAMRQHHVHSRAQIQAKVRRDVNEPMTQTPDDLRYATIFRTENIDGIFGMFERGQRSTLLKNFDAYWREVFKQIERPLVIAELHALESLHALRAREAPILRHIDSQPGSDKRFDAKTRTRSNRPAHVVREFRVDKYYSR